MVSVTVAVGDSALEADTALGFGTELEVKIELVCAVRLRRSALPLIWGSVSSGALAPRSRRLGKKVPFDELDGFKGRTPQRRFLAGDLASVQTLQEVHSWPYCPSDSLTTTLRALFTPVLSAGHSRYRLPS